MFRNNTHPEVHQQHTLLMLLLYAGLVLALLLLGARAAAAL